MRITASKKDIMKVYTLDRIDKHIIYILLENCRTPYQEIATKTGITSNAVRKRINNLEKSGFIEDYIIELRRDMINASYLMAWVETDGSIDEQEFSDLVGNNDYVVDVTPLVGGFYAVFAYFVTTEDMSDITRIIRGKESILKVDIHPLVGYKSDYVANRPVTLKKLHFRILKPLMKNPKMQVSEIAQETNLSARMVRRALKEINDHGGIKFTIKWNPEAHRGTHFLSLIRYDDSKCSFKECTNWLTDKFPIVLWELFESTITPLLIAYFVVPTSEQIEEITREIRKADFADSVISYVATKTRTYENFRISKLWEMIDAAGV